MTASIHRCIITVMTMLEGSNQVQARFVELPGASCLLGHLCKLEVGCSSFFLYLPCPVCIGFCHCQGSRQPALHGHQHARITNNTMR